jgi:hypothetical protein
MSQENVHCLVREMNLVFCSECREIERSCLPLPFRQSEVAKIKFGLFKTWIQKENWKMIGGANHGILDDCWARCALCAKRECFGATAPNQADVAATA